MNQSKIEERLPEPKINQGINDDRPPSAQVLPNPLLSAVYSSAVKKEFYDELKSDKIQINWNKNPIRMKLLLSFLTVDVKRSTDHLGSCTGWTLLVNDELKLKIGGGVVNGIELLNSLQFGTKLSNPYNNYVNPFYLFEVLNIEGQQFFIDYYKDDIQNLVNKQKESIASLKTSLSNKKELLNKILSEIETLSANSR